MAKVCRDMGVEISFESPVAKVLVDGGKAVGVKPAGGEEIAAARVIANVGPKLLYERMMDAADLPQDFQRRIKGFKAGSGTFRMHVPLPELPRPEERRAGQQCVSPRTYRSQPSTQKKHTTPTPPPHPPP